MLEFLELVKLRGAELEFGSPLKYKISEISMALYPRDLVGYGQYSPNPRWPNHARLALQFVINYEEGGESCILHGDTASEAFLSEIIGAAPLPGVRNLQIEGYSLKRDTLVWVLSNENG